MQTHEVLFKVIAGNAGNIGHIILNRPQALNALSIAMILSMYEQLDRWQTDPQIKAVVISGNGDRAFCAGGDVRYSYDQHQLGRSDSNLYFWHEYRLNHAIRNYSKPYIALLHGITMGGGVGISVHGSHRVAADNLVLAMPETSIGFFPDVGTTYVLPRLPDYIGYYLGLTGQRINANDAYAIGIADAVVAQTQFEDLINALADIKFSINPKKSTSEILADFHQPIGESSFLEQQAFIKDYFSQSTIEKILQTLSQEKTPWAEHCLKDLATKSPTSLCVTLKALQLGAKQNFDDCMRMEYRIASRLLQSHDFFEGIRAALIDKDRNPKWQPSSLEEINPIVIEQFFAPLSGKELSFEQQKEI